MGPCRWAVALTARRGPGSLGPSVPESGPGLDTFEFLASDDY